MFGLFNIFGKKKPEITVTLEVNTPEYDGRNEGVYTPPPPAKIPENACCPYCGVVFDTPPTRKKKCGDCGGYIYVRTSEDRVKLYLSEEGVKIFDQEIRLKSFEDVIGKYGYTLTNEERYSFARDEALLVSGIKYYLSKAISTSIKAKEYYTVSSISYDLDYLFRSSLSYGKNYDGAYIKQAEDWAEKARKDGSF